jgi:transposase
LTSIRTAGAGIAAGLSYHEIALALDVPVGTVRTWLHRAREVAHRELAAETDDLPLVTQELI